MRFARDHTHNGTKHKRHDPYTGSVNTGRFFFHRGILEPDGSPGDALITGPKVKPSAWSGATDVGDSSEPTDSDSWGSPPLAGEQE